MKAPRITPAKSKSLSRLLLGALLAASLLFGFPAQRREERRRLPDGRNQMEEILKDEHRKSLADAARLAELAEELKIELEKNDRHVVSMSSIRKTEEIERLAKRIRARLKRS